MYGIYANIWGILMVNVTIYTIHGSYGFGYTIVYGTVIFPDGPGRWTEEKHWKIAMPSCSWKANGKHRHSSQTKSLMASPTG